MLFSVPSLFSPYTVFQGIGPSELTRGADLVRSGLSEINLRHTANFSENAQPDC